MYIDNPNRPRNYNEKEFYNQTGQNLMKDLESKWWKKTERFIDVLCIFWFSDICDYYHILEGDNKIYLHSYEIQQFNKFKWCIIVKEHKYKNLIKSKEVKVYKGKEIIWNHMILNIEKDTIDFLTTNCIVWQKFDLWLHIESFKKWNEHKDWYLAIPNT